MDGCTKCRLYCAPGSRRAAAGFALSGARIGQLRHHPVAVLVCCHRDHVIDVFVRPGAPGGRDPAYALGLANSASHCASAGLAA